MLTLHQVAEQLQVHWITARGFEADGLRVVKLGKTAKSWRVDPVDLAEYLAKKKTQSDEGRPQASTWSKPIRALRLASPPDLDELLKRKRG